MTDTTTASSDRAVCESAIAEMRTILEQRLGAVHFEIRSTDKGAHDELARLERLQTAIERTHDALTDLETTLVLAEIL